MMCANADPASCGDGPVGCHGIMIHHGNGGHHDEGRLKGDNQHSNTCPV